MPDIDFIRREIEHMRVQLGRQRREILQLQRAGICTASAELLLGRMHSKIDDLCAQRDRLRKEQPAERRVLGGRSW
jgi:hypothetical protein